MYTAVLSTNISSSSETQSVVQETSAGFFLFTTGVLTPSNDCYFATYYNNIYLTHTSKLNHHAQHNCILFGLHNKQDHSP